jgi:Tfp pilus assembly protein PilP
VSFARAIQVMGVVQTKGKMTAIVEVPGEGTPRAVSVGERLGNGTVLVKRIQADGSQEPIVVLEERGREIFRAVGSATTSINPAF